MSEKYRCNNPEHPADAPKVYEKQLDGFCPDCEYGTGLLERIDEQEAERLLTEGAVVTRERHTGEIGLCILVCDVSYSMHEPGFSNNPARKIDLITRAAASGIADLYSLSSARDAYIALIAFGEQATLIDDSAGHLFVKSVQAIKEEFSERQDLAEFLAQSFTHKYESLAAQTNITEALKLARDIDQSARSGSLASYGVAQGFTLKEHDLLVKATNTTDSIPNVRTMIYSDGEHNAGAPLVNPYAKDKYSTLMTMYFGSNEDEGAFQMKSLACICPQHDIPGFFLINSPTRYATLRHLFRMASGASGFCAVCSQSEKREHVELARA